MERRSVEPIRVTPGRYHDDVTEIWDYLMHRDEVESDIAHSQSMVVEPCTQTGLSCDDMQLAFV